MSLTVNTPGLPTASKTPFQFMPRRSASPWWLTWRRRWLRS
jgi:hypothetical protein